MENIDRGYNLATPQNTSPLNSCANNNSPKSQLYTELDNIPTTASIIDLHSPGRKRAPGEVVFNVAGTKYSVVRSVGKDILNWTLSTDLQKEWDVAWIDYISDSSIFYNLKPFQKVSFFPGIKCLARKDQLGLNLMKLKRKFPKEYDFFPETFILPYDYDEFKTQINKGKQQNVYIVKPQASCQGKGIFLTKTIANVDRRMESVAQKYLTQPYLIEGLKFDMRIYVFLANCDPLKIYLYDDGLARFATEPYRNPQHDNLADVCMHLTNYAINKNNPNFIFNNSATHHDRGHKRSIKALFKILKRQGHDVAHLWNEIKKIIIKTFCSGQPILAHTYRSYNNVNKYSPVSNCFQIFGFDIMLDKNLKPWLLEVNQSPSWTTDTPLDKTIKENVIKDALNILNISAQDRIDYKRKVKEQIEARSMNIKSAKPNEEQLKAEYQKMHEELDRWEAMNGTGGYEKIFPLKESAEGAEENYNAYLAAAKAFYPFRDNSSWEFPTASGVDGASSPRLSPKVSSKPPPMLFGVPKSPKQYHPYQQRKSENQVSSKGTVPKQNVADDNDLRIDEIAEEKSSQPQKEKKVKNSTLNHKSSKSSQEIKQKILDMRKSAVKVTDFDDLLEENAAPTSSGTSNKSVEQKEDLIDKTPSRQRKFPTASALPKQLAASIFERLAAGRKHHAKISLRVPSNPSDAVHIDLSNTHKMILEKGQDEPRSGAIPKRFAQNLSNKDFVKPLLSSQGFRSENASAVEGEVEQETATPSSVTPKADKAAHTKDQQSYGKIIFGREGLNRPSTTQFGNYLMPKRFENPYNSTKAKTVTVADSSYEKTWQKVDAIETGNSTPIGSFLKSSLNHNGLKKISNNLS